MKKLITIVIALLCISCGGSTTAPMDIADVRKAIEYELNVIATGLEREDAILASQAISERFTMSNNVAVRYLDANWSGTGIGKFREFFDKVFKIHENIEQYFEVLDVYQVGEVATARVRNELISSRVDWTPPEGYTAAGWDWFIFERDGGEWLLISWDEAPEPVPDPEPEPEPHEEGEGESS